MSRAVKRISHKMKLTTRIQKQNGKPRQPMWCLNFDDWLHDHRDYAKSLSLCLSTSLFFTWAGISIRLWQFFFLIFVSFHCARRDEFIFSRAACAHRQLRTPKVSHKRTQIWRGVNTHTHMRNETGTTNKSDRDGRVRRERKTTHNWQCAYGRSVEHAFLFFYTRQWCCCALHTRALHANTTT